MMPKISPFSWIALSFFGYYCAWGVVLPFLVSWLAHNDFSAQHVGWLIALGNLARFSGSLLFSRRLTDVRASIRMLRLLAFATASFAAAMALSSGNAWAIVLCLLAFFVFCGAMMPIAESIASSWQRELQINYGKARLFGSMAFVLGSLLGGVAIQFGGKGTIIWTIFALYTALMVLQLFQPREVAKTAATQAQPPRNKGGYLALLRSPQTARMMLAASLISSSHAAYYTYSTLFWADSGLSAQVISVLWAVSVMAEVVLFFFAQKWLARYAISTLVSVAALGALVRWLGIATLENVPALLLVQCLHACSFALLHFAMVRYISGQALENIPKLQALYSSLASCAAMALMTFVAGLVYPLSAQGAFYLMGALVLPVFAIVWKIRALEKANAPSNAAKM